MKKYHSRRTEFTHKTQIVNVATI